MEAPTARWGISLPTHAIRTPGHDEQQDKMDNNMLVISNNVALPDDEMEISAIRAQGAGGQNVNKVATAIHLRFDIRASSLPDFYKERLLSLRDKRITGEGVIIIKAQRFRTQEKNREDALERLSEIIRSVTVVKKARKKTRPTKASQRRRVDEKTKRGKQKALRRSKPSLD